MAQKPYRKVSTSVWHSKRFRALDHELSHIFFLYLLASPHTTTLGTCALRPGYFIDDFPRFEGRVEDCIEDCERVGLIAVDRDEGVIAIRKWFQESPIVGPKHFKGALRLVDNMAPTEMALDLFFEVMLSSQPRWDGWSAEIVAEAVQEARAIFQRVWRAVSQDQMDRALARLPVEAAEGVFISLSIPLSTVAELPEKDAGDPFDTRIHTQPIQGKGKGKGKEEGGGIA